MRDFLLQIYCFEIEGTPEWPSGTAVTAYDRRTASTVLLYRDLGPGAQLAPQRPGDSPQPNPAPRTVETVLEDHRRALAVIGTSSHTLPSSYSNGTQPAPLPIELFSYDRFIGLAAPDAAAAAPALERLRAEGLFRVAQAPPAPPPPPPPPVFCLRCREAQPVGTTGLCAACASATTNQRTPRLRRAWLAIVLLIAAVAVALFIWWPKPAPRQTTAPAPAPIIQFSADHYSVTRGSHVQLFWKTSGLSSLSISPNVGAVPASGKHSVRLYRDTTFSLVGTGTGTGYVRPVTVNIHVVDPEANPPSKPSAYSGTPSSEMPQPSFQTSVPPAAESPLQRQPDSDYQSRSMVSSALDNWAAAYRSNDPRRQAALYSPQVERFFKQQNVTNDYVLTYMTNFYARGRQFTSFSFTSPAIALVDHDNARVNFIKSYTLRLANGETHSVTSRSELHLVRISGSIWKINFERDFF